MAGVAPEATGFMSLIRGESAVLPWFLPGVAISVVLSLVLGGRVGRVLGTRRVVASMLILSLGVILSATLTPLRGVIEEGVMSPGVCDLSRVGFPSLRELLRIDDTILNILLFVPLGASIAFLPRSRRTVAVIACAIALPFAIEITQLIVTALSRGCQSADVVDNLTGLALGLAGGVLARLGRDQMLGSQPLP
jgi:glycopeptide antibiotics resistance protein